MIMDQLSTSFYDESKTENNQWLQLLKCEDSLLFLISHWLLISLGFLTVATKQCPHVSFGLCLCVCLCVCVCVRSALGSSMFSLWGSPEWRLQLPVHIAEIYRYTFTTRTLLVNIHIYNVQYTHTQFQYDSYQCN